MCDNLTLVVHSAIYMTFDYCVLFVHASFFFLFFWLFTIVYGE